MRKIFLMLGATMLLALPALAMTTAEVQAEASTVAADYQSLAASVDACPGGECSDAQALMDAFAVLEVERAHLHADRQTLGTCSQPQIDGLISLIDRISDVLSATLGGWDEEG